jgi:hypothetical protein
LRRAGRDISSSTSDEALDPRLLGHAAFGEFDDECARCAEIAGMSNYHHSDAFKPMDFLQDGDDFAFGLFIEIAGRLVGHEDFGLVDERPRDDHPLLLAG